MRSFIGVLLGVGLFVFLIGRGGDVAAVPALQSQLISNSEFTAGNVGGWLHSSDVLGGGYGDCPEPPIGLTTTDYPLASEWFGLLAMSEECFGFIPAFVYTVSPLDGSYLGGSYLLESEMFVGAGGGISIVNEDEYWLIDELANVSVVTQFNESGTLTSDWMGTELYVIVWVSVALGPGDCSGCPNDATQWVDYVRFTVTSGETPTPTETPTDTPEPTETPTETPTPTDTPEPTETPTPGPTPEPSPTPALTDIASYTIDLPSGGAGRVLMTMTAGEFAIATGLAVLCFLVLFDLLRKVVYGARHK